MRDASMWPRTNTVTMCDRNLHVTRIIVRQMDKMLCLQVASVAELVCHPKSCSYVSEWDGGQ